MAEAGLGGGVGRRGRMVYLGLRAGLRGGGVGVSDLARGRGWGSVFRLLAPSWERQGWDLASEVLFLG